MWSMNNVESVFVLILAATLLVRLADLGKIPAPIVLVVGGLAVAFVPGLPSVELDPDTIFLVFLPPLVYAAGWRTSPQELRAVMRPLAQATWPASRAPSATATASGRRQVRFVGLADHSNQTVSVRPAGSSG